MKQVIEEILARLWNRGRPSDQGMRVEQSLDLGARVIEEQVTKGRVVISHSRRAEHIAILGKTGTGKSSLLRYCAAQDIKAGRGFIFFDLHGDAMPFLIAIIAEQERITKSDLSDKTIIVEPSDPEFSVGLNALEHNAGNNRFIQIGEFAQVFKQRWQLDSLGARTEELLRNALYAVAENGLTLIEIALFLSNAPFRAQCLKEVKNPEVHQYFTQRYEQASEPMRAVMREPILNKVSAFTADTNFRHIVGQAASTFSVAEALEKGRWVILNLHKGKLGEQAITLGSLLFTKIKNALFSRTSRRLFTLYCDEIQNLVALDCGLETILSEARKFAVSVVSANQYLDQYPQDMRSAILAVGTHVFFQLSSPDAHAISNMLDGGKALAEHLKNLPRRHVILKTGHERWCEAQVPTVKEPKVDSSDLYNRCRNRWARRREVIEEEIIRRQSSVTANRGTLDDWE